MAKKYPKLGDFLRDAREEAGLSQRAVSDKFGYTTPQFISNWERGESFPPLKTLKKLADLYKIKSDDLFEVLLETKVQEIRSELEKSFYKRG